MKTHLNNYRESKLSLSQLKLMKDINIPLSMGLETAKFMNGIHVARALNVDNSKCLPTSLNRYPVGMEALVSRSGVLWGTYKKYIIFQEFLNLFKNFSKYS
ncbi:hypothetical protein BB561_000706 [Smittium simulii]|uniref:Uncharacterized protein n=1 Tax=Smittium simulii TaxID=133385 RepID=A0A2T9YXZ1_9FUNG|nr:hypothetical protein BB561_000706 [Smittium simulii]